MDYDQFVQQKRRAEVATGHQPGNLNEHLFDFQHAIVSWAVRRGRAAIFADTGLGKTLMQLSWADEIASHTGGMVLVLAPLAVSEQTIEQGHTSALKFAAFRMVARLMRLECGSQTMSEWMQSTSPRCMVWFWMSRRSSRRTTGKHASESLMRLRASRIV